MTRTSHSATRRVTVHEGHVALILPQQHASELMSMCLEVRKANSKAMAKGDSISVGLWAIAGDTILHLIEAGVKP